MLTADSLLSRKQNCEKHENLWEKKQNGVQCWLRAHKNLQCIR